MRCASFCDVQGCGCVARKTGLLDTGAFQTSNCALSKATRGHDAVAQILQEAAYAGDPSAETEASGLIPGTELRPADVLTSAPGNALAALDVSICSPHAQEAGLDCTQSMVVSKLAHKSLHLNSLLAQNTLLT